MDINRLSVRPDIFESLQSVCIRQASSSVIVGRKL